MNDRPSNDNFRSYLQQRREELEALLNGPLSKAEADKLSAELSWLKQREEAAEFQKLLNVRARPLTKEEIDSLEQIWLKEREDLRAFEQEHSKQQREEARVQLKELLQSALLEKDVTRRSGMERPGPNEVAERRERRQRWLRENGFDSEWELSQVPGMPTYKTIQRWGSGIASRQDRQVQRKIANALKLTISDVPE